MTREEHIADMERRAATMAAKPPERSKGNHVGTQGQREEFTGTVKYIRDFKKEIEGHEIESHLSIIETDAGDIIKYWNLLRYHPKGQSKIEIGAGVRATFRATVALHEEYKGEKQTLIQRAHVIKVHEPVNSVRVCPTCKKPMANGECEDCKLPY